MKILDNRNYRALFRYWHVRIALKWISSMDLRELGCVELVDGVPSEFSLASPSIKRISARVPSVFGWYVAAQGSAPAMIALNMRVIADRIPFFYWCTPVPTLLIAGCVAHEVGHHLVATRGYIFKPKERLNPEEYEEAAAQRYAHSVIERMERKWCYKLGRLLMNDLASWYHVAAVLDLKEGKYEGAVERFTKACTLNPDLDEAASGFRQAREKFSGGDQSREHRAKR